MWDEITYPFPNFNGATVDTWEFIGNFIRQFWGMLILKLIRVSKRGHLVVLQNQFLLFVNFLQSSEFLKHCFMDHSRYDQWDKVLHSDASSHWLTQNISVTMREAYLHNNWRFVPIFFETLQNINDMNTLVFSRVCVCVFGWVGGRSPRMRSKVKSGVVGVGGGGLSPKFVRRRVYLVH